MIFYVENVKESKTTKFWELINDFSKVTRLIYTSQLLSHVSAINNKFEIKNMIYISIKNAVLMYTANKMCTIYEENYNFDEQNLRTK